MGRTGRRIASLLLVASSVPAAKAAESAAAVEVHIPGATSPAVLERLESRDGLTALAVSPDLERVAVAYLESEKPEKSTLRIYTAGIEAPESLDTAGRILDLLFDRDQDRVYGVLYRSAKKREGDNYLVVYEPGRGKLRRALRLPASARGLDHWTLRDSLLVASRDEIRTLHLPDLRSGPLFRVPGDNLSLTAIAGGNLVLIGQTSALVLVNLTDPPGQFEMPIRGRARSPGAVVSVAASPDGAEALARLDDGRLFDVRFDPLRMVERGSAMVLTSLEGRDRVPESPDPVPLAATESPESLPEESDPSAVPDDASLAPAAAAAAAAAATAAAISPSPSGVERDEAPPAVETAPETDGPRLEGRIVGPAASAVVSVIVLGPNSIVREAARVTPSADGRWRVDELEPGRYRVQLDGGGGRVVVSDPPFLLLEIRPDGGTSAPDIRVVRAM